MVMSREKNTGVSQNIKLDNSSFERLEQFQYLGVTATDQNSSPGETKGRFKAGNACYHSVQNLGSSSLLSKKLNIKTYRTIILPVAMYRCETWSLTLREERRMRVFENRVLRRIFEPKRDEVTWEWRELHNEELNGLYSSPNSIRVAKSIRMKWTVHVPLMRDRKYVYKTKFLWGNLRERDHLEDPGVDERILLRCFFRNWDVGAWTGLV
jgi:hypothetical protein